MSRVYDFCMAQEFNYLFQNIYNDPRAINSSDGRVVSYIPDLSFETSESKVSFHDLSMGRGLAPKFVGVANDVLAPIYSSDVIQRDGITYTLNSVSGYLTLSFRNNEGKTINIEVPSVPTFGIENIEIDSLVDQMGYPANDGDRVYIARNVSPPLNTESNQPFLNAETGAPILTPTGERIEFRANHFANCLTLALEKEVLQDSLSEVMRINNPNSKREEVRIFSPEGRSFTPYENVSRNPPIGHWPESGSTIGR